MLNLPEAGHVITHPRVIYNSLLTVKPVISLG